MYKVESDELFSILADIMDETVESKETDAMGFFVEFQLLIDEKLIPAIELIQYERKYELIECIKGVSDNLALYLHFPELIGKTVIGIHYPSKASYKAIYKNLLKDFLDQEMYNSNFWKKLSGNKGDNAISEQVPTFIHPIQEKEHISVFNLAENVISVANQDYIDLLSFSKSEELDLASILYGISIPATLKNNNSSFVIIPEKMDTNGKYFTAFMNSVDVLIIEGKNCCLDEISKYENLSKVIVFGKISSNNRQELENYTNENSIDIYNFNSLDEAIENSTGDIDRSKNNLCFVTILKNILFENAWYLAERNQELSAPLSNINDNLLFKDEQTSKALKQMQQLYKEDLDELQEIYKGYTSCVELLIEKLSAIQEMYGVKEGQNCINDHIVMEPIVLDLIIKMIKTYSVFPEANCKDMIRNYVLMYAKTTSNKEVAEYILNTYLKNSCTEQQTKAFKEYASDSVFVKRFKIDCAKELGLSEEEIGKMAYDLGQPFRGVEKVAIGKLELKNRNLAVAKKYLFEAATIGNEEAGKLLVSNFMSVSETKYHLSVDELRSLADYGVAEAAYLVGKNLYDKIFKHSYSETKYHDMEKCLKYFHIAAAKSNLKAIKLLGNISLEKFEANSNNEEEARRCLYYYSLAEKKGSQEKMMYEKMGYLNYKLEKYKEALKYLKKADTAEANYYLGRMYEDGNGCAVNEKKSLECYEKAMDSGHSEASVQYERLMAKMEEEKQKNIVQENVSYSSSSYRSGYSSYSGW